MAVAVEIRASQDPVTRVVRAWYVVTGNDGTGEVTGTLAGDVLVGQQTIHATMQLTLEGDMPKPVTFGTPTFVGSIPLVFHVDPADPCVFVATP